MNSFIRLKLMQLLKEKKKKVLISFDCSYFNIDQKLELMIVVELGTGNGSRRESLERSMCLFQVQRVQE